MAKYVNKELNISIEVPDNYTFIDKKYYNQIGLDKTAQDQTLFLFINTNSVVGDSFNVTRDSVFASDKEALTTGVQANINNLEKQNCYVVSKEDFVTMQGKECVKVICQYNSKLYVNLLFTAIDGLLICLGYNNSEQDYQKEALFEQILSSLTKN